eukprot:5044449-Heterocapsa_arctica.AAC.1
MVPSGTTLTLLVRMRCGTPAGSLGGGLSPRRVPHLTIAATLVSSGANCRSCTREPVSHTGGGRGIAIGQPRQRTAHALSAMAMWKASSAVNSCSALPGFVHSPAPAPTEGFHSSTAWMWWHSHRMEASSSTFARRRCLLARAPPRQQAA